MTFTISLILFSLVAWIKQGPFPRCRVMLSLLLKRYYGLLRLPYLLPVISVFLTCMRCSYWLSTNTDLPSCTINLPLHTIPATPKDPMIRFRSLKSSTTAFPQCPKGQHLHFKLTRLHIGSLALRSAVLPRGNLQPLITQTLLPGTKEVYEQFLLRDFNPIRLIFDNGIRTRYLIILCKEFEVHYTISWSNGADISPE